MTDRTVVIGGVVFRLDESEGTQKQRDAMWDQISNKMAQMKSLQKDMQGLTVAEGFEVLIKVTDLSSTGGVATSTLLGVNKNGDIPTGMIIELDLKAIDKVQTNATNPQTGEKEWRETDAIEVTMNELGFAVGYASKDYPTDPDYKPENPTDPKNKYYLSHDDGAEGGKIDEFSGVYQDNSNKWFGKPLRVKETPGDMRNGLDFSDDPDEQIENVFPSDDDWRKAKAKEDINSANPHGEAIEIDDTGVPPAAAGPSGEDFSDWLKNLADGISSGIAEFMQDIVDKFNAGLTTLSPLVLDLDGDGIELSAYSLSNTSFFDLDQDGFAERSGWVNSDDGLLALDLDADGRIESNAELFGTADTDGFTIASLYDLNADGILSEEDAVWGDLRIWRDFDQDGISDAGELYTLSDYGILNINLNATEVSLTNQGHPVSHTSTYTYDTGSGTATRAVHDIWFNTDNVATRYSQDYTFDMRAAFLPTQRGYGEIADLHIAMSLDNEGTGNLLELVSSLKEKAFSDLFDSTNDAKDDVRNILYRWAGVDDVAVNSRGGNINAQELAFLEKLMGQDYLQLGTHPNPYQSASYHLKEAFEIAFNNFYARLLVQSAGGELFEGEWFYNVTTDSIDGVTGLNETKLGALESEALGLANTAERQVFWENVVRMVEFSVGTGNLDISDLNALRDAIADSDSMLDLEDDILAALESDTPLPVLYSGTSGDDTISASSAHDRVSAGNGNDIIDGNEGNDVLEGGAGNDTYIYNIGDGYDWIQEGSGLDKIVFGSGIDLNDLTFTKVGSRDLIIDIDTGSYVGQIYVSTQFDNNRSIETLEFSDTSTYDLTVVNWTTNGTDKSENIFGTRYGGGNVDIIYAGAGNDSINAYEGDDTIYAEDGNDKVYAGTGNDIIYAGSGNDYIDAGDGNDIIYDDAGNDRAAGMAGDDKYYFTSGNDIYQETGGADEIYLPSGFLSANTIYYKISNDLKIVLDTNNSITIPGFYSSSGYKIETLKFFGGTDVDLTTLSPLVQGDDSNNSLSGTALSDTLYGFGGNDTLSGLAGDDFLYGGVGNDSLVGGNDNDYLDGGAGDDVMNGGAGNDTFFYVSGHDTIQENSGTDIIKIAAGWNVEDFKLIRSVDAGISNAFVQINGSNSITFSGHFGANNMKVETLEFADLTTIDLLTYSYETHGNASNNSINGVTSYGSLHDVMYGYAGNDSLSGGSGNDILYGGDGNDDLNGGVGDDYLDGGAGDDYMHSGEGNDVFFYSSGHDLFAGLSDTNVVILDSAWSLENLTFSRSVDVGLNNLFISIDGTNSLEIQGHFSGSRMETLQFSDLSTIDLVAKQYISYGNASNNTISGITSGGSINDIIYGYAGNDTLNGGTGNDILDGGDGNDALSGAAGDDIFVYAAGLDTVTDTAGTDALYIDGGITVNDISFSSVSSYNTKITITPSVDEVTVVNLRHGTAANHVEFIEFADGFKTSLPDYATWTTGTSGADSLTGTSGDNTIIGKDGNDTLDGAGGNDDIHGGSGNDTLYGGAGADLLHGGVGDDTLYGQDGLDTLFGGAGADTFVFETASAFNNLDVIKDFSTAQNDVLDLSDLLGGYDPLTDAITDFVWITESAGNSNVFVDRDGLGGTYSLVAIATLSGVTGLTDEAALLANGTIIA